MNTSYFSAPADTLDPTLFDGRSLKSQVRSGIQSILIDLLGQSFRHADLWTHPWLAGSGVSYQWQAAREPKDLDCLVGINFIQFRKANPEYAGLSDREIADELNDLLHNSGTEDWNGFELTYYALTTNDIKTIKPYAAYDLKYDEWTVTPNPAQEAPNNAEWDSVANSDASLATNTYNRYQASLQDVQMATNEAVRRNSEVKMTAAAMQANALYNEIHNNRSIAFSPTGQGYGDFHNYRWQAGKQRGTINKLRTIRQHLKTSMVSGMDIPDSSTLIRRAATYRNK